MLLSYMGNGTEEVTVWILGLKNPFYLNGAETHKSFLNLLVQWLLKYILGNFLQVFDKCKKVAIFAACLWRFSIIKYEILNKNSRFHSLLNFSSKFKVTKKSYTWRKWENDYYFSLRSLQKGGGSTLSFCNE